MNPAEKRDWERLAAWVNQMQETLAEVAASGVTFQDDRLSYVEVQVDRDTWEAVSELTGRVDA